MKTMVESKIDNNTREYLYKKYINEIEELESLIGKNSDSWRPQNT